MKYSMTCSCGEVSSIEAATREEAVRKLKSIMSEGVVAEHMKKNHPDEKVPTLLQAHQRIDAELKAA